MKPAVIYKNKYLSMAEMVRNILRGEGVPAAVRTSDPFGAFTKGPHLGTYQPTPCSIYEVIVPPELAERAGELIEGIAQDEEGEENDA